ncbi:hypothetical protein GOP47_0003401 [Adiantum capillus-veneris]|uniref:Uncharacterized protein n=1 Tax=Adiantum capillus-veneris TaxID=13818 RepID=A0A9D4VDP9_ADICA|nr:hypothetical protein GOP47_0003401 [Adiantum capillus-veneris]
MSTRCIVSDFALNTDVDEVIVSDSMHEIRGYDQPHEVDDLQEYNVGQVKPDMHSSEMECLLEPVVDVHAYVEELDEMESGVMCGVMSEVSDYDKPLLMVEHIHGLRSIQGSQFSGTCMNF